MYGSTQKCIWSSWWWFPTTSNFIIIATFSTHVQCKHPYSVANSLRHIFHQPNRVRIEKFIRYYKTIERCFRFHSTVFRLNRVLDVGWIFAIWTRIHVHLYFKIATCGSQMPSNCQSKEKNYSIKLAFGMFMFILICWQKLVCLWNKHI